MIRRIATLVVFPLLLAGCQEPRDAASQTVAAADARTATCEVVAPGRTLPAEVRETSGLARSARDPGLFWTHNDAGNAPELFAVNEAGELVQRVRVAGAQLVDWEDLDVGPCGDGACLYIADIGDNDAQRDRLTVYRVAEPAAGATETGAAQALHARYPDGPRDAEALFVDASGTMYIVTKGRETGIALYRWPAGSAPGEVVTLERVRELFPRPSTELDRVTAATTTPSGRWVGIRTYRTLFLVRADQLLGDGVLDPIQMDLSGAGHGQGESLVLGDDGTVWLSGEAESGGRPQWARLKCAFPTG